MSKVYACSGSCHGVASQQQYDGGATTCGAETCEKFGQPLEPKTQCPDCLAKGQNAACESCKAG